MERLATPLLCLLQNRRGCHSFDTASLHFYSDSESTSLQRLSCSVKINPSHHRHGPVTVCRNQELALVALTIIMNSLKNGGVLGLLLVASPVSFVSIPIADEQQDYNGD